MWGISSPFRKAWDAIESSKSHLANSCNKMLKTLEFFLFPIESEEYLNLIHIFIFSQVKKIKQLKFYEACKWTCLVYFVIDTSNIAYWIWYVLPKNICGIWHSRFPGWHQSALCIVYNWRCFCLSHHCILKLSISAQIEVDGLPSCE